MCFSFSTCLKSLTVNASFYLIWVFGRKSARTTGHLLERGAWRLSSSNLKSRRNKGEPPFERVPQHHFHGQRKPSPGGGTAQDLVVPSTQISTSAVRLCGSMVCSPLVGQGFVIPRPSARLSGGKFFIPQILDFCLADSFTTMWIKNCKANGWT